MTTRTKVKIAAGAAALLVLAIAVGAASAIAGATIFSGSEDRQAVIDDAARQLGVEPEALSEALEEALGNRVDRAVEDGRLTEEQGERLKERIDSGAAPLFFGALEQRGFGPHGARAGASLDAAAAYLDVTRAELRERLHDGDTLADVARAEGKSVDGLVGALVEAATERIQDAVEAGRLTEERASELGADLEDRMTSLVNGELRGFPHRLGPHARGPHGLHDARPFHGPHE